VSRWVPISVVVWQALPATGQLYSTVFVGVLRTQLDQPRAGVRAAPLSRAPARETFITIISKGSSVLATRVSAARRCPCACGVGLMMAIMLTARGCERSRRRRRRPRAAAAALPAARARARGGHGHGHRRQYVLNLQKRASRWHAESEIYL
jgi:hypothetical protein